MSDLRLLTIGTISPEDLAEIGDQPAALVVGDVEAIRELAPLLGKSIRIGGPAKKVEFKIKGEDDDRPADPTETARQWLAAYPQAPGAEHVAAMLASSERYRKLAAASEDATGSKVVIVTANEGYVFTTTTLLSDFGMAMAATAAILAAAGYSDDEIDAAVKRTVNRNIRRLTDGLEAEARLYAVEKALRGEAVVGRYADDPIVRLAREAAGVPVFGVSLRWSEGTGRGEVVHVGPRTYTVQTGPGSTQWHFDRKEMEDLDGDADVRPLPRRLADDSVARVGPTLLGSANLADYLRAQGASGQGPDRYDQGWPPPSERPAPKRTEQL